MLGVVSSVYDPLGLVLPRVVGIKLAMQDLWKSRWDGTTSCQKSWLDIPGLQGVINSCFLRPYVEVQGRNCIELHCFADAFKRDCGLACKCQLIIAGEIKTCLMAPEFTLSNSSWIGNHSMLWGSSREPFLVRTQPWFSAHSTKNGHFNWRR